MSLCLSCFDELTADDIFGKVGKEIRLKRKNEEYRNKKFTTLIEGNRSAIIENGNLTEERKNLKIRKYSGGSLFWFRTDILFIRLQNRRRVPTGLMIKTM